MDQLLDLARRRPDWFVVPPFLLILAAQLLDTKIGMVLRRPLWLDEVHTALIVEDPSPRHAFRALAAGADMNPPALYAIDRAVTWCARSTGPAALRTTSLVFTLAGIVGIYAITRRAYAPRIALAAAAAAWANPLLLHQAFEARFYAPWFGGIVWFAYALNAASRSPRSLGLRLLLAATSVFVCTIHYFGVFSLLLVIMAQALVAARRQDRIRPLVVWMAAGPMCLLACIPMYRGQRRSLSAPTWISMPGGRELLEYFGGLYDSLILVPPMLVLFASLFLTRGPARSGEGATQDPDAGMLDLAGLGSLALMPMFLAAFTLLIQPALLPRYAIVAVGSLGVLGVPLLARSGRIGTWAVLATYLLYSTVTLHYQQRDFGKEARSIAERLAHLRGLAPAPLIFKSRHALYREGWASGRPPKTWYLWDEAEAGAALTNYAAVERDVARTLNRWYGMPQVLGIKSLSAPHFYLVGFTEADLAKLRGRGWPLTFRPVDLDDGITEVTPATPSPGPP